MVFKSLKYQGGDKEGQYLHDATYEVFEQVTGEELTEGAMDNHVAVIVEALSDAIFDLEKVKSQVQANCF